MVNLLVVEDVEADFLLIQRHLWQSGLDCRCRRVARLESLTEALEAGGWDALLSGDDVPGLDCRAIVARLAAKSPDLPIILLADRVGEERVVELLKAGVWDLVPRDNLARLLPVIERSLGEAAQRQLRRAAEKAMMDGAGRFRSLFDNMLEGYAYCRMAYRDERPVDFVYLEVNDAFAALTGLRDVVGRPVSELIPGIRETNPELFEIYGRVARSGRQEKFETFVAGLEIWFSVAVYSPARDHFIAIFENVTERKSAERALQERDALYRGVIEASSDGFWMTDIDGRLLEVNDAYLTRSGYRRGELFGMRIGDLDAMEDPGQTADHIRKVMHAGRDLFETRHRARDGSVWPVEINVTYSPVAGGRLFAFIRDISARKAAELDLRDSEARANLILDTSPTAMLVANEHGGIVLANTAAERVFGYGAGQMQGLSLAALIPGAIGAAVPAAGNDESLLGRRLDGSTFPLELGCGEMSLNGHRFTVASVDDVGERKRTDVELQRFARIVATSGDLLAFVDREGRYQVANPAYAAMHGTTPAAIFGATVEQVLGMTVAPQLREHIARAQAGEEQRFVTERLFPDGRLHVLDAEYRPFLLGGRVEGVVVSLHDITERVRIEQALRVSEQTLQRVQAMARMGSWVADFASRRLVVTTGDTQLIGRTRLEADFDELPFAVHPEDAARVQSAWEAAMAGASYDIEHRVVIEGQIKWVHIKAEFSFAADGRPLRGIGMIQDVT